MRKKSGDLWNKKTIRNEIFIQIQKITTDFPS